ncbi:MAG: TonB-dependent receptor plug domain-containing protein [Bacteroidota bacterium]
MDLEHGFTKGIGFGFILLSILMLFGATHLVAQHVKRDTLTVQLSPIIVTASRTPMMKRGVPATITFIPVQEVRSLGSLNVLDAVARVSPGVFITERGVLGFGIGPTAAGRVNIRGVGENPNTGVLVLIDGRPNFAGLFGHPLPDAYAALDVDHVEVLRGPASVLYGSNALGGVVNIITKKSPEKPLTLRADAQYGSYNTQSYSLHAGVRRGNFEAVGAAMRNQTDGHRPNSSFRQTNASLNIGYMLTDVMKLRADGYTAAFTVYDPGPETRPIVNGWYDVKRSGIGLTLENNFHSVAGSLMLFLNYGEHKIYDGFHSFDRLFGLILYETARLVEGNEVSFGFDVKRYGGTASNEKSNKNFGFHYITEWAPYVHLDQLFGSQFIFSAGARLEHNSVYGSEFVPAFGLTYHPFRQTSLKLSAAKGFRDPTIRELYLFPAPTPTLKPERLWNYEIGIEQFLAQWLDAEGSIFYGEGDNLIRQEGIFPNITLRNSGHFIHRGAEISLHAVPLSSLSIRASASFLNPGNETQANPKRKLCFVVSYAHSGVDAMVDIQHVAGLYGQDFSQTPLKSYTLVDARLQLRVMDYLSCAISARNLLNTPYEIIAGYPMPGRTLMGELSMEL